MVTGLGIPEHEFFEKPFGVDFLQVSQDGLLFGKGDVHKMFFEIPGQLKIELAFVAIEVDHDDFGEVVTVFNIFHEGFRLHWDRVPVEVLLLLQVLLLERRVHCYQQRVNHVR